MTSEPMRDQVTDPLLTPENAALLIIDYQPSQMAAVTSMDHDLLSRNVVSVARLGKTFDLPIVLSTVNVVANGQPPTLPELKEILSDNEEIDRTQINFVGGRAVSGGRRGNGPKEADHGRVVDRGLPHVPSSRCSPRRLRGLSGRRCRGRHVARSTPGGIGAHRPSGRPADRMGFPRLRAATRLGPDRHGSRGGRHRADVTTSEGALSEVPSWDPRSTSSIDQLVGSLSDA